MTNLMSGDACRRENDVTYLENLLLVRHSADVNVVQDVFVPEKKTIIIVLLASGLCLFQIKAFFPR